jgi:hypothetical protein
MRDNKAWIDAVYSFDADSERGKAHARGRKMREQRLSPEGEARKAQLLERLERNRRE